MLSSEQLRIYQKILEGKFHRKKPLKTHWLRLEDNIKVDTIWRCAVSV